jgi:hypothetical protein
MGIIWGSLSLEFMRHKAKKIMHQQTFAQLFGNVGGAFAKYVSIFAHQDFSQKKRPMAGKVTTKSWI